MQPWLASVIGDEVLDTRVGPYADAVGDTCILTDDNATILIAWAVLEYLERKGIGRLEWPNRFPDLNPIETPFPPRMTYS